MKGFKKVTYEIMEGDNFIGGKEAKNVTLEEAIKILSCPGVINVTFKRYTKSQAFKLGAEKVWEE